MTFELSERVFAHMVAYNGDPNFGTEVLGITQENLDRELNRAKKVGWDKEEAVRDGREINGTLHKKSIEMTTLLYVAKGILTADKKLPEEQRKYKITFKEFCDEVGITVVTANRWIREWRDPEGEAERKSKAKQTKIDNTIIDNADETYRKFHLNIFEETDDYIEVEINYLGTTHYEKLKRE